MSGPVFAIGGHEDREGERVILRAVAAALPKPMLAVITVASKKPAEMFDTYVRAFTGIVDIVQVGQNAVRDGSVLDGVGGVFFTGGDQLRIMSTLGGTPLEAAVRERWQEGCVVAGTSAGASVLAETMIVRGGGATTPKVGDLRLDAGLGILPHLVIDQHFAERGRIGRLVSAVAQNPELLGIGIDEDTAIVVRREWIDVIGEGSVTVLDASWLTVTNVFDAAPDATLSARGLVGHLLAPGDRLEVPSWRLPDQVVADYRAKYRR